MKRVGFVEAGMLFILGTVLLVVSCTSPTVPRLPREDDPRPAPDTTKTGMGLSTQEVRSLAV